MSKKEKTKKPTLTKRVEALEHAVAEAYRVLNFHHPLMVAVYQSLDKAEQDKLVSMGVVPTAPKEK